ncbi:putative endonuclease [Nitrospira sp.]|nr:putative endonuclease [Nitrospira sp.]
MVGVLDGDTIDVLHNGKAERIRLRGVDCPEKKQPFGQKAKQFTSTLVFGKTVSVVPSEKGRYGRTIGDVFLPNGANLSYELVKAGLAWWYHTYSDDVVLAALELDAQVARRGLWIDPRPIPPWEYRHPKKNNRKNEGASKPLVGVE